MVSLLGLSLIERVILTAKKSGIKEFYIVIGYHGEKIREYLSDGKKYGVNSSQIFGGALEICAKEMGRPLSLAYI